MSEYVGSGATQRGRDRAGRVGGGVAVSLAARGRPPVAVFDVRSQAADGLVGVPAMADSPAAVGSAADVVLIAVITAAQAREVLDGERGVLSTARSALVVVPLCTVAWPACARSSSCAPSAA